MSPEREELARLVAEIPDTEVPLALTEMRKHLTVERPWPPEWFAIAEGDGTAVGASNEDILAEGFGR